MNGWNVGDVCDLTVQGLESRPPCRRCHELACLLQRESGSVVESRSGSAKGFDLKQERTSQISVCGSQGHSVASLLQFVVLHPRPSGRRHCGCPRHHGSWSFLQPSHRTTGLRRPPRYKLPLFRDGGSLEQPRLKRSCDHVVCGSWPAWLERRTWFLCR